MSLKTADTAKFKRRNALGEPMRDAVEALSPSGRDGRDGINLVEKTLRPLPGTRTR